MKFEVREIGPQEAEQLLSRNSRNRPVVQRRVDDLVAAISGGDWRLTHQGIAVLPDGQILDGQHRLMAIVRSGKRVPIMVTQLDEDVFDVIDTGRARTPRDVLALAGIPWAQRIPSAVRLVEHYRSPQAHQIMGGRNTRLSNHMVLVRAQQQPAYVKWAPVAERTSTSMGRRGLVTGLLAAMVVLEEDAKNSVDAREEFFNKMADPVLLTATSPILALRRWLTVTVAEAPRARAQIAMYGTIRAWNAYIEARPLGRIQVRLDRDGAPAVTRGTPVRSV